MAEVKNVDGIWSELSDPEYVERFNENDLRYRRTPITISGGHDSRRVASRREDAGRAGSQRRAQAAGLKSIFDLSGEDDESISLDELVPQESDDAGAEADYLAKNARKTAADDD